MVLGRGRDGGLMIMSFNSGGGRSTSRAGQTSMAGASVRLLKTLCLGLISQVMAGEVDRAMVAWPCKLVGLSLP